LLVVIVKRRIDLKLLENETPAQTTQVRCWGNAHETLSIFDVFSFLYTILFWIEEVGSKKMDRRRRIEKYSEDIPKLCHFD
jgi:hypothetical protein